MSEARAEVLARIREALAGSEGAPAAPVRSYRTDAELSSDETVTMFVERASEYRVGVRRCGSEAVSGNVSAAAAEHDARRLAIPPELPARYRPHDLELVEDHDLVADELDRLDGALTASTLAIAETGTLVLAAGGADGRRVISLVPDLHICIVDAKDVVATVPEAIAALANQGKATMPLTFVSGPSATSDIELSRVEGVHGPRRLEIVLVG